MNADEMHIEVGLRYDRVLVVPLSKLADVLALLCECQYQADGYGNDRTIRKLAATDLPDIKLVPPHMLLSARLAGDVTE